MKKTICLSFIAIALLLSPIAYGQSTPNPLFGHLPPKADHVYDINFSQINTKGNLDAILSSIPPGKDPHTTLVLNILRNPAAAGIDLSNHIIFTQTSASGSGADTLSFTNILVQLSDSAKFRAELVKAIPDLHIHRLAGKGASAAKEHLGLAWNDRLVAITLVSRESPVITDSATTRLGSPGTATHPSAPHRPISEIAVEKSIAALAGFTGSTWTTDERFLTGFATDADIHFWSTGMNMARFFGKLMSKLASKNPAMQAMPNKFASFPAGPANTPVLSTLNFADGRIVFHTTTFNQPDNAATLKRFVDRPFNKDLIARLPNGLLLGWMAMRVNPAAYKDVLEKFHTRQMVDSILAKKGLSIEDFTAIFAGDILIAAIAPDSVSTTDTAKKKVNFYFVASISDPSKLMQLATKISANAAANPDTAKAGPLKNLANKMVIQDNLLVVSGSREQARKYFTHTDRRPTDRISDDNDMQHIVIDLKAVSSFIGGSMGSDPKAMIIARVLEKLDRITFGNGVMDGNNTEATFQIVTAEPSTNSLATLMSILH